MTKPQTGEDAPPEETQEEDAKSLSVKRAPGETDSDARAHVALRPTIQAAVTVRDYTRGTFGELSLNTLVADLQKQCALASMGDTERGEAILTAQAHTLDAIFNHLVRRAQRADYLPELQTYLRLGLKAQSQCRGTLEALAGIKNPSPVAFVQQANISHGPQLVNNAPQSSADTASSSRVSENAPNKLLEQQRNGWLDTGTSQAAVGSDSGLEAVGAVHGPRDTHGQS